MASLNNFQILCVIFSGFINYADSIYCYQCGDSKNNAPCMTETAEMEAEYYRWNSTDTVTDGKPESYKYIKKCSDPDFNACVIERIEELGTTHAYIRDCSNGRNFSIAGVPKFGYLDASLNHTTCAYIQQSKLLACVTLCDKDLCNGPQIDGTTSVLVSVWMVWMALFTSIFATF